MSRLDDLITELCPDGVEHKKIGDIANVARGVRVVKSQLTTEGAYPVYQNSITSMGYYDKFNCPAGTTFVISAGAAGEIGYSSVDFWAADDCFYFDCPINLNSRYLFHSLLCQEEHIFSRVRRASIPRLARAVVEGLVIPVPPLPVQQEIVRILDKFTTLEAELEAELEVELEARKKLCAYYKDYMLTFSDDVPMVMLSEIASDMYRGSGIKRDEITDDGNPCARYGEIYTTYNIWFDTCVSHTHKGKKTFEHGDILFAITGESVEEIAKSCTYIGHEKCFAGGDIVVMKHKQNPKYIAYALSTSDAQAQKSKGKVKSKVVHSSIPALKDIQIPLPTLAEQERIVTILDRFDTITNALTSVLPAEIAARRKQYEYYRDQLLTFKERVS
jgi:type I restriction enzyme S subunit